MSQRPQQIPFYFTPQKSYFIAKAEKAYDLSCGSKATVESESQNQSIKRKTGLELEKERSLLSPEQDKLIKQNQALKDEIETF